MVPVVWAAFKLSQSFPASVLVLLLLWVQVVDEGKGRAVVVEKEGFPDAVVWNPWIEKAAGMSDFGDEEYKVGWPIRLKPLCLNMSCGHHSSYNLLGEGNGCI